MNTGIYVGHKPETVLETRKAILEILNAKADQSTIRHALSTLEKSLKIENVSISNVTIDMTNTQNKKK